MQKRNDVITLIKSALFNAPQQVHLRYGYTMVCHFRGVSFLRFLFI